ncbi:MAG TPA: hypothetical protein VHL85_09650 [Burkholderiales bacterium]|nr:hypothetical protein [Burkholderiales bacterium]
MYFWHIEALTSKLVTWLGAVALAFVLSACATPVPEVGVASLPQQPYGFLAFELDARFVGRSEDKLPNVSGIVGSDVDFGKSMWVTVVRITKRNDLHVLARPVGNYRYRSFQLNDTRLGVRREGAFSIEQGTLTYIGRYDFRFDVGTTVFGWSQLQGFSLEHSNNIDAVRPEFLARLRKALGASADQIRVRYSYPFE